MVVLARPRETERVMLLGSRVCSYSSLYQQPRDVAQEASFRRALGNMSMWYAHPLTTVLIVRGQDAQLFKYANDEATGALVRTDEPNPRDGRGWPVYEERMATLGFKDSPSVLLCVSPPHAFHFEYVQQWELVVEVGGETAAEARRRRNAPPMAPSRFGVLLDERLTFTNGADREVVRDLYRRTAEEGFGGRTALCYTGAGWGDADVAELGAMLREVGGCPHVTTLDLSENRELRSAEVLGGVLGTLPALEVLDLRCCMGLTALPEAVGECMALRKLNLYKCGLNLLPDLSRLTRLERLNLSSCTLLRALPEGLGGCVALQTLELEGCCRLKSLPPQLGECAALRVLQLDSCDALTSLPDLSGLARLEVYSLPHRLEPWEANRRRAYSVPYFRGQCCVS